MLPPFIIDQIRRRETDQKRRGDEQQPTLEVPDLPTSRRSNDTDDDEEDQERGVVIIDLG